MSYADRHALLARGRSLRTMKCMRDGLTREGARVFSCRETAAEHEPGFVEGTCKQK